MSAPLANASFEPDVVLIYCDPTQLTMLLFAAAYRDGSDLRCDLSPHAACVYPIVPAVLQENYQVAIPCPGDRRRAMTQDDELIFSIPRRRVDDFIAGLKGTNMRIPFGFTLMPQYKLTKQYAELARSLGMKIANGDKIE